MHSKFNAFRQQSHFKPSSRPSPSSASSASPSPSRPQDEYERWVNTPPADGDDDVNPFKYWHRRQKEYPRLSRMALDCLSAAAMSTECERLFSSAGEMVSAKRSHLESHTISMTQCVRSWVRAGLVSLPTNDPVMYEKPRFPTTDELTAVHFKDSGLPDNLVRRNSAGRAVGLVE